MRVRGRCDVVERRSPRLVRHLREATVPLARAAGPAPTLARSGARRVRRAGKEGRTGSVCRRATVKGRSPEGRRSSGGWHRSAIPIGGWNALNSRVSRRVVSHVARAPPCRAPRNPVVTPQAKTNGTQHWWPGFRRDAQLASRRLTRVLHAKLTGHAVGGTASRCRMTTARTACRAA
jgi:hypothetical protein